MTAISSNKILNEIVQLRFALMGKGRGFSSSASAKSDLDYGKLIRQKEQEIIELVHAYNKTKKKLGADSAQSNQGKTGYASSSSDKAKSLKITHFRRLLLS